MQFTAKKVLANIDFTDELEADSVIAILPLVREKLIEGFALAQEAIAINGDDAAAAGHILGNVGADDVARAVTGLRRHAIDNSADVDFSTGGLSATNLRALRTIMGKYGKSPSDLVYVVTMKDYNAILGFDNYQTLDKFGQNAVIMNGVLGAIDGIPVIVSEQLPADLNAAGVYDGTTTTKGTCMLVNKKGFMWGDRKEFGLETFRNPFNQVNSLIGSQRLDFQKVLSSTAQPVAIGINY
jgi:HK97 family phage major capsid protein